MTFKVAYHVGIHRYSFRPDVPAEIIGVRMVRPMPSLPERPCFEVRYPDGTMDFMPVEDPGAYRIVSQDDPLRGPTAS